jgi:hypothetical protein
MEEHFKKAVDDLKRRNSDLKNPTHLDYYLMLENIKTIYEFSDNKLFSSEFKHIYNSAMIYHKYDPKLIDKDSSTLYLDIPLLIGMFPL